MYKNSLIDVHIHGIGSDSRMPGILEYLKLSTLIVIPIKTQISITPLFNFLFQYQGFHVINS